MTAVVGEKNFIRRMFSGHVLKITMALKRFNPEKYDPRVLMTKEKEWTGEVSQAVSSLIDHAGEMLSGDLTEEESDAIHEIVETQNDLYQEFLTKYHHKMLGVTAAAGEDVINTAGEDSIATQLSTEDGIIANQGTAAKYDLQVPDKCFDADTADLCGWETLLTVDRAEHVSVCSDTGEMTELVLGKVPSHSDHELDVNCFYLAKGSGQFTYMPGMEVINNLVVQMLVLRHVPVITQICSVFTLSGYSVPVPVFAMTQSGVKAGVDSGGDLCLTSVT